MNAQSTSGPTATSGSLPPAQRASVYFSSPRSDLLALVPADAQRILDVGCGVGRVGQSLKSGTNRYVVGIELNAAAAQAAAAVLDGVICGSVDKLLPDELGGPYDCIIFGDILEHLYDPWTAVCQYCRLLTKEGVIVASIPNIGHWSVIAGLLAGRWEYASRGLLDRTHIRFFTQRSIRQLFAEAGLEITRWEANYRLVSATVGMLAWRAQRLMGLCAVS